MSQFSSLNFEVVGDEDYDVADSTIRLEFSYDKEGWKLWNVCVGDQQRFGHSDHVGAGPFRDWLDAKRAEVLALTAEEQR